MQHSVHERFMRLALEEAALAAAQGEIPVGAVVVKDGAVLGRGHNTRERDCDPTAHAEIVALRNAAKAAGDWRLDGCTLYVTLEPCAMCTGASIGARVAKIVYGAKDEERGTCGSVANLCHMPFGGQTPLVQGGVEEAECGKILKDFFDRLRK